MLEEKDNYYKNHSTLQNEINEINTWKDKMLKEKPTNNQLIHLRNKLRVLKQNEMKLKELNAQSIVLLTKSLPETHRNEIDTDSKRINEEYDELVKYLTEKEAEIKRIVHKKGTKMEDDYKNLQSKISKIESVILNEHAMIASEDKMADKIDNLKKIQSDFDNLKSSYEDVVEKKKEKYAENGGSKGMKLATSVDNLVIKFSDTKTILDQKIGKLEKGT